MTILYLLFAIFGLGFLIFIHELGHYWMARRVGMRVESFGIGFGRPIYSFERHGVKWNICWLPFGGYVKIAGMEKEGNKEPDQIEDGFFGKSPWDRIKVAFMGPLANLVLAFVFFFCIWASGGREKSYAEVTAKIGWIDPRSELYQKGIRPGDIILSYDDERVKGSKDHFHAAMTGGKTLAVKGLHWDQKRASYVPFTYTIHPYPHPQALESGIRTTGVLQPASFIFYPEKSFGAPNGLPKGSPLASSGIQYGDRIVWLNGERIYSLGQLSSLVNDKRALITIKRQNSYMLRRVAKVVVEELKLTQEPFEELHDWQYEARLTNTVFQNLLYIPYNLSNDCVVEGPLSLLDSDKNDLLVDRRTNLEIDAPLHVGDVIVAVNGTQVEASYELLRELQTPKALIIVDRSPKVFDSKSYDTSNALFDAPLHAKELSELIATIGRPNSERQIGTLHLLNPVVPKTREEIFSASEQAEEIQAELEEEKRHIQAIDDPEKRARALKYLESRREQLLLGIPGISDLYIQYNPNPLQMFQDVVDEVVHTLSALIGGYLNPKWISGPIGIVQVIHHQWMAGIKEALFWMGVISLNLGLLNLLPLPVLDGGYICLSLFEIVTGKKIKAKTLEKLIIPFAVLLISFLIYLTYNDLLRLLTHLFKW